MGKSRYEAKHLKYSSARDYEGINGLIEVENLGSRMHFHRRRMGTRKLISIPHQV